MVRLASLVPRPRANLTRFHGVSTPAYPWRRQITGMGGARKAREAQTGRVAVRRPCGHPIGR